MRCLFVLCLMLTATLAGQDPNAQWSGMQWTVTHERALWPDAQGSLALSPEGFVFTRAEKKPEEERPMLLRWDDIQQATLAERRLEIVTYHDVTWQIGRDRIFRFRLSTPDGSLVTAASILRAHLGERAVVALHADPSIVERKAVQWRIPAKRLGLVRGVEGVLIFTGDELLFDASRAGESRIWPVAVIDTIAQTGPLSLNITAPERAVSDQGGYRSFAFQLKQPLSVENYQALWRRIEHAHGTRLRFRGIQ
ncbi:MAG: hypothetical protein IT169_10580 [Bryobacterales bacterium]|nr:hypothetical protein [Bryobacterales bacterium]